MLAVSPKLMTANVTLTITRPFHKSLLRAPCRRAARPSPFVLSHAPTPALRHDLDAPGQSPLHDPEGPD